MLRLGQACLLEKIYTYLMLIQLPYLDPTLHSTCERKYNRIQFSIYCPAFSHTVDVQSFMRVMGGFESNGGI